MIDEMADAVGIDPVQFRLMHITRLTPGDTRHPYESLPTVEVLREGAKAFGWEKRNPVAGGEPGRFKRGFGLGMSQHHGGLHGLSRRRRGVRQTGGAAGREHFQQRTGRDRRWQRDHEDRASRQRIECGHGAGSHGRGDAGIHDARSDPPGLGRLGHRAVERRVVRRPHHHAARSGHLQRSRQAAKGSARARRRRPQDRCRQASDARRRHLLERRSQEEHDVRRAGQGQQWPDPADGRGVAGGERTASNKGVGACFVEVEVDTWTGDWRFVRVGLHARHRTGDQPAGGRSRHGGIAGGEHSGGHRPDSVGPRISGHAALQRRLPVLPASHHHGHSQVNAGVHRQPGAALVLRRQELQRNQHRRGAGRDLERDLQRLRRPHSGASHHAGKDHGRARQ